MLILTRTLGEQIRIGDNMVLAVMGAHGPLVSVGIDAPRSVMVLRAELLVQSVDRLLEE